MTNFFRTSTHSSALQQAIEKATDPNQDGEDWSLIMNICDHVSAKQENAKEAMKIIRKRLQTHLSGQGLRVVNLTLNLLEALSKNCGRNFHLQIAHRDFLKELKHVIGPKNNPPVSLQRRVLTMIQNWALAFRNDRDLQDVEFFYQECKQQGLEFPPVESERAIQTAIPSGGTIDRTSQNPRSMSTKVQQRPIQLNSSGMSAEQLAKLRSELDVVQTNVEVFGEMLVTMQPGEENPQDFELLMELHRTCQQMQSRIVELLGQVTIDEITSDLLRYNDAFNHSFKLFENYVRERDRNFKNSPLYNRSNMMAKAPAQNEPALIQFDDEPTSLTDNFRNIQISPSVLMKPTRSGPTPSAAASSTATIDDAERDVREVEQWLKFQGDIPEPDDSARGEEGTTAAFNNFLQKRASTIPTDREIYPNLQPISNRIDRDENRL